MDFVRALTDPVAPADSLLDAHWIPREVVVYENVAVLEVQTFAGNLAGKEYLEFAASELRPDSLSAFFTPAAIFVSGRRGTIHQLRRVALCRGASVRGNEGCP